MRCVVREERENALNEEDEEEISFVGHAVVVKSQLVI
jgi:hypothetical protein